MSSGAFRADVAGSRPGLWRKQLLSPLPHLTSLVRWIPVTMAFIRVSASPPAQSHDRIRRSSGPRTTFGSAPCRVVRHADAAAVRTRERQWPGQESDPIQPRVACSYDLRSAGEFPGEFSKLFGVSRLVRTNEHEVVIQRHVAEAPI